MGYYINCIKQSDNLVLDVKELITDMNLRRRMSRVVCMGVSTALESLVDFDQYGKVDAIITATGLGCIADSEKFLANIITSQERMLNPTPFIQSTFNTVGAQIALIRSLHCYNNTFSHRYTSLESALVDAIIRLDSGLARAVLVGVFDEATPTFVSIMSRMGLLKEKAVGEGAIFFVLTHQQLSCSVAVIEEVVFDPPMLEGAISVSQATETIWSGSVAEVIANLVSTRTDGWIHNDVGGKNNSLIKLRCL
ncbi:MAG: beta-ketoacyl synthase chain length factor [Breznakibacter sp.]